MVALDRLGQLLCAVSGHDYITQFEHDRMCLVCSSCGHESPGWDIPHHAPADRRPRLGASPSRALDDRRVA